MFTNYMMPDSLCKWRQRVEKTPAHPDTGRENCSWKNYSIELECSCMLSVSDSLRPHGLWPVRLLCLLNFAGKTTGVGFHFLLQGIFLTQGFNPRLWHWQVDSVPPSRLGIPIQLEQAEVKITLYLYFCLLLMTADSWYWFDIWSLEIKFCFLKSRKILLK